MFRTRAVLLFVVAGPALAVSGEVQQNPAEDLFARKCASCHTVGKGVRVGPDLKDANKRRSRSWLERFVTAPSAMLDADPDARNLLTEFKGVRMPDLGLQAKDVSSLVDLLVRCSAEPCNLVGKFTPVTLATAQDVARGHAFFTGELALKTGGAPCLSCHTVRGAAGAIGGGTLAKDLTNVFARLGDEGLDRALAVPAFPLMNKVFTEHPLDPAEVFALRAFLFDANRSTTAIGGDTLSIGLFAGIGTIAALVVLNAFWARRLGGVRRPLTQKREQPS
jgi:mono/diheme cytochrome c family protein